MLFMIKGVFIMIMEKGDYASGYPYGREFPENANLFDLSPWRSYSPFDTCASAQMIIKKVVEE